MNILESIAEYLEDNDLGVVGTNIFIGELPDDENNIVSIVSAPSPDPNKSIPYYTQTVDIWARYSDFDDGYGKLQDIFDTLHREENYEIEGYHVYLSYASGMILDLDRDSERRHLLKVSFGFVYRESSELS